MKHEEFKKVVESLPSYQRLSFIHGERLFIRDADSYRIVSIQALYELASRPTGIIVTSEKLSKQQREELLTESDGYTPLLSRKELKPEYVRPPPLVSMYPVIDDHDDALTDGQVWIAIGIIILLILIISFSAFPNP